MHTDDGESLVEVLLSLAILGLAMASILGGMATSIFGSSLHRSQSDATAVVKSAAETLKDPASRWESCATPATYTPMVASVVRPAGWAAPAVESVRYWNGTAFQGTCDDTVALGHLLRTQEITIRIDSSDGRDTERLTVVKQDDCAVPTSESCR